MSQDTKDLYNGDCPVCSFEIRHYKSYAERQALPLGFDDLNTGDLEAWGVTADMAARRLHVAKDGEVYSGIPAFVVLWQDMPRYRWLARIVSTPGIFRLSVWIYDYLLAPLLYHAHLRRMETKN